MSFVSKSIKKVFNFHKKIHSKVKRAWKKKWVRGVVIGALAVFAVGLGSGGFKNWSTWTQEGGFWNAVGKTFATGFGTIWNGMKSFFTGKGSYSTSPSGVDAAGQTTAGMTQAEATQQWAAKQAAGETIKQVATRTGSRVGGLWGSTVAMNFISSGLSYWGEKQQYDEERKRADNATVYGGPAFGGSADLPEGYIRSPLTGKGAPGESVASSIAFGTSDAGTIKTRPLFNPSSTGNGRKYTPSGSTELSRLPAIAPLLQQDDEYSYV